MAYWNAKDFNDSLIGSIVEAAIASTYSVVAEARERANTSNPMQATEYTYTEACNVLLTIIPLMPASDVLRAEGLAFRLMELAKYVSTPQKHTQLDKAQAVLDAVQNLPAYRALLFV